MILCCLKNLSGLKEMEEPSAKVLVDRIELLHFVAAGFPAMNDMFERARLPEAAVYQRTTCVGMSFRRVHQSLGS